MQMINTLKERYDCLVGYSGHEEEVMPSMLAPVYGACVIERHVTLSHKQKGFFDENDRLSFQRFLGLKLYDTVPDAKTIWHFREELNKADILDTVFYRFVKQMEDQGIITRSGSIVDAELKNLVEKKKDKRLYGDSAYTGEEVQSCIPKTVKNRIHEKRYQNHPLTKTQKRNNKAKSRIRARVEHVFAAINHFGGLFIRTIGIKRAEFQIGLMNFTYNLTRYAYIMEAKV